MANLALVPKATNRNGVFTRRLNKERKQKVSTQTMPTSYKEMRRLYWTVPFDMEGATRFEDNVYIHSVYENRYSLNQVQYNQNLEGFYSQAIANLKSTFESQIDSYIEQEDKVLKDYGIFLRMNEGQGAEPEEVLRELNITLKNQKNSGAEILLAIQEIRDILTNQYISNLKENGKKIKLNELQSNAVVTGLFGDLSNQSDKDKGQFNSLLANIALQGSGEESVSSIPSVRKQLQFIINTLLSADTSLFTDEGKTTMLGVYGDGVDFINSLLQGAITADSGAKIHAIRQRLRMKLGCVGELGLQYALFQGVDKSLQDLVEFEAVGFVQAKNREEVIEAAKEGVENAISELEINNKKYSTVPAKVDLGNFTVDVKGRFKMENGRIQTLNIDMKSNAAKYATTRKKAFSTTLDVFLNNFVNLDTSIQNDPRLPMFYYLLLNDAKFGKPFAIQSSEFSRLTWLMFFVGAVKDAKTDGRSALEAIFGKAGESAEIIVLGNTAYRFSSLLKAALKDDTAKGKPTFSNDGLKATQITRRLFKKNKNIYLPPYSAETFDFLYSNSEFVQNNLALNKMIKEKVKINYIINLSYTSSQLAAK